LPATFAGELPGPAGNVRWQLDLMPDGRYLLRQVPTSRRDPNRYEDSGRWNWERQPQRLVLRGARQETIYLELAGNGMLRKLDGDGRRLRSAGNDLLQRTSAAQPTVADQRLAVSGMFTVLADAARITLCADGRSLPVAMEGDFPALQAAWRAARPLPGQALLVSAQGLITLRPSAEPGRPPVPTLVIERFDQVWPGETCGQPQATSPLRGTHWKLVRLNNQPVAVAERGREPHLVFAADQLSGSGGCNRMSGAVAFSGERIAIEQIAATRMACSTGMAQESAFFDSLERATRWRVAGSHLELLDGAGRVLARFEAMASR
jgi:copper homeostasis protein (lipoprotein)